MKKEENNNNNNNNPRGSNISINVSIIIWINNKEIRGEDRWTIRVEEDGSEEGGDDWVWVGRGGWNSLPRIGTPGATG